jgi:hypothetical protein
MPTKRQFDMTVISVVLLLVAFQVAKAASYRWRLENPSGSAGHAAGVALGA